MSVEQWAFQAKILFTLATEQRLDMFPANHRQIKAMKRSHLSKLVESGVLVPDQGLHFKHSYYRFDRARYYSLKRKKLVQ